MIEVTYVDHMGDDLSVVNAARVSFGKKSDYDWSDLDNIKIRDRDVNLIKYLAKHQHYSPFGHAFASFHIKAPIFVHAQLLKHKFLRANTISRRYVDDEPEFYVPEVWRGRSADKKQGSEGEVNSTFSIEFYNEKAFQAYDHLLNDGVAPEQARMVLPQSTMTEWYWSGSLDAFAAMYKLRVKEDTQLETRLVANQIDTEMSKLFPVSWNALVWGDQV